MGRNYCGLRQHVQPGQPPSSKKTTAIPRALQLDMAQGKKDCGQIAHEKSQEPRM